MSLETLKGLFKFRQRGQEDFGKSTSSELERVAAMARKCMSTDQFKKYRERYVALERSILEELITDARRFTTDQSTMEKFGAKCLVRLTRLYDVRSLLVSVASDEKRDKGAGDGKDRKDKE